MEKEDEEDITEGKPSALVLLIGIVSLAVLAPVLIYISLLSDMELSLKLWLSGLTAFLIALISYILHSSAKVKSAKLLSVAFFALCAVLFYLSVWFMPVSPVHEGKKTIGLIVITIILILILFVLIYTRVKREKKERAVKVMIRKRT